MNGNVSIFENWLTKFSSILSEIKANELLTRCTLTLHLETTKSRSIVSSLRRFHNPQDRLFNSLSWRSWAIDEAATVRKSLAKGVSLGNVPYVLALYQKLRASLSVNIWFPIELRYSSNSFLNQLPMLLLMQLTLNCSLFVHRAAHSHDPLNFSSVSISRVSESVHSSIATTSSSWKCRRNVFFNPKGRQRSVKYLTEPRIQVSCFPCIDQVFNFLLRLITVQVEWVFVVFMFLIYARN